MSIKSLTVTEDAYDALKRMKHGDESFSDAILRLAQTRTDHIRKYTGILHRSEEETEEWLTTIKKRRQEIQKEFDERQKKIRKIQHGSS